MALDAEAATAGISPGLMVVMTRDFLRTAPDGAGYGAIGVGHLRLLQHLSAGLDPSPDLVTDVADNSANDAESLTAFIEALTAQGLLGRHEGSYLPDVPAVAPRSDEIDARPDDRIVIPTPLVFQVTPAGFVHLDHAGGAVITLDPAELAATAGLGRPMTAAEALVQHREAAGPAALDDAAFAALIDRLDRAGLTHRILSTADTRESSSRIEREWRTAYENLRLIGDEVERRLDAREDVDTTRTAVIGVHPMGPCPPLAIAMVMSYAQAYEDGKLEEHFDFFPQWVMQVHRVPTFTQRPAIFLYSNYLWSTEANLEISAEVKAATPGSINIHGGPDTPKYQDDVERFFADNPQVDIAVRGEGEATFAGLLEALAGLELGDTQPDLSGLQSVPGLCYRDGDRVVRTEDRDRITEVDSIPSPYLTGLLDAYGAAEESTAIIETNRGCPYGCTFCDWGSATLSRIRKFDLDRIFAELEWCAQNRVSRVWLADANFGIFERDVEIAQKVASLKGEYGYPKVFATNYAKNTIKHLKPIVKVMADAGILTEGLLSLQSMDEGTLKTIKRSNIKLEKYEELAREFRAAKLPLFVDLMVGLPGATLEGFHNDLQECLNREVSARIFSTTLLVNSPMNEPSYKAEHKIETELRGDGIKQQLVVSTATFSRADHDTMLKLREIYIMCENHGMLRQISRWVRQEVGMMEVDLYETLWKASLADRDRWPAMAFVFEAGPSLMVPPVSWRLFIDDVHRYLVDVLGLPDDDALETVMQVQHGLLPTRNRTFPDVLELPHDFGAWHHEMIRAKDEGHIHDWPEHVTRLRDLPPAPFTIDDPNQVCTLNMGYHVEGDIYSDWELRSPVARSMPATHLAT